MKIRFIDLRNQPVLGTEHHAKLPRTMRKTLRITTPKSSKPTKTSWDADLVFDDEYVTDTYLNANTCDPDFDLDGSAEFGDIDNEYEGLSIADMGRDTRRWLKGYNIL